MRHKYGAKKCEYDDIKFSSKLEGKYYQRLKRLKESGEILFFLRQVPFHLPGNTKYIIDFVEFHAPRDGDQGDVIFTEVKGYDTAMSKLKISQAEDLYGIKINMVRKC
jgi:hypothetical protein